MLLGHNDCPIMPTSQQACDKTSQRAIMRATNKGLNYTRGHRGKREKNDFTTMELQKEALYAGHGMSHSYWSQSEAPSVSLVSKQNEGLLSCAHRLSTVDHNGMIRRSSAQVFQFDFLTFNVLLTRHRKTTTPVLLQEK